MAKCFLTGIEVQLNEAYLLDRGAAQRALRSLRQRLAAVERLVSQLSPNDEVQVFDLRSRTTKVRSQRRLICKTVAAALSASYPESPLFQGWQDFTARRPPVFPEFRENRQAKAGPRDGASCQDPQTVLPDQDPGKASGNGDPE